jgi:type I restriction enzyme S subunit
MGKLNGIFVDETERKITDSGLKNSSAKLLPINSIILSSRAPIGYLAINKKPISTNQGCKGIIPKNVLDFLFLYYFLKKSVELLNRLGNGTTFKELSGSKLAEVIIPLPPLPEQKRIVAILDEAFENIAKAKENAERNLKNAKEIFEGYLQSVFENKGDGWEEKTLGKIATFEYGYTDKAKEKGDLRYIRITDIDSEGNLTNINKVYLTSSKEVRNFIVQNNDLLMARTGATFGKVLLYDDLEHSVFASYLIRIKFKEKIENKLYWYFSKSRFYWDQAKKLVSGSAQPHFNGNALDKMIFSYPKSIHEQQSIVAKIDALSAETKKLEVIYKKKLADLEEIKKSILAKAFNGELKGASA